MKRPKIVSVLALSIITFVSTISIHQSSLAKSTTLNWATKLNSDSLTTINSHNSILNIGDKITSIFFAINPAKSAKQIEEFFEYLGRAARAAQICISDLNNCKNVFSFIFEYWYIIILILGIILFYAYALRSNNE